MKKLIVLVFISIAVIFTTFECKKQNIETPAAAIPGANEIWIQNMAFNPASITVSVNTTIKWTNKEGITHTVTSNNGLFDSGNISSNGTYSHQFTTAGTYPYHCTIHSSMTGTIIVK
jgi:plastocyanin